jgi:Protein ENHANCED DISEASE RESISTANCE 2, C-terminal
VVGLCRGYAKNIVNDVGIVIQGEQDGELPERILAVGSLNRINVNIRQKLD